MVWLHNVIINKHYTLHYGALPEDICALKPAQSTLRGGLNESEFNLDLIAIGLCVNGNDP